MKHNMNGILQELSVCFFDTKPHLLDISVNGMDFILKTNLFWAEPIIQLQMDNII